MHNAMKDVITTVQKKYDLKYTIKKIQKESRKSKWINNKKDCRSKHRLKRKKEAEKDRKKQESGERKTRNISESKNY